MQSKEIRFSDLSDFKKFQVLGYNDFLYSNLGIDEKSKVIVLGGYRGDSADYLVKKYNSFVDIYEPMQVYFNELKQRFNNNVKVRCFNSPLTADGRKIVLSENLDGTNIFGIIEDSQATGIQSRRASSVINEFETQVDLIEINIEGAEYEVLEDILQNSEQLPRTILLQTHTLNNESLILKAKLRTELEKNYFCLYRFDDVWERWERMDWINRNPECVLKTQGYINGVEQFWRSTFDHEHSRLVELFLSTADMCRKLETSCEELQWRLKNLDLGASLLLRENLALDEQMWILKEQLENIMSHPFFSVIFLLKKSRN